MRRLRHLRIAGSAALACALTALCLTAIGGAATSTTFTDPAGDGGFWLDITSVDVSEEGDGSILFQVHFAGRVNWDEDGPRVALDLDRNPDTGSGYYGTEVEVAFEGEGHAREGRAVLYRANGWDFRGVTPPEGWGWGLGPHEVDFFLSRSFLGLAPDAGFNLVVATTARDPDTAPNVGTFDYEPVPGAPPPLGPDRRPPRVFAYDSRGVAGRTAKLDYWVLEGRGKARQMIRIYKGRRRVATIATPLSNVSPFRLAHAQWRVPRGAHGRFHFSVRSIDAAGNKSTRAWASLVVRSHLCPPGRAPLTTSCEGSESRCRS
jgi:hypothetical protein